VILLREKENTMPLEIVTIPCLNDNYAYLVHDATSGATAVVDVPDANPIQQALAARNWQLSDIFITHHHDDHIQGVDRLRMATSAQVWGARNDAARLPALDHSLIEGDALPFGGETGQIFDVSGHTVGHLAFYFPQSAALFTADSLMALGCGRLFEGTAAQMHHSLSKLTVLPPETLIFSGHEYTASNAKFALTIEPANEALTSRSRDIIAARAEGRFTVPSSLAEELATNPFLRSHIPGIKRSLNMVDRSDLEVFAEVRRRKDKF
jgi:hydroxyacylglutathione hydrolase